MTIPLLALCYSEIMNYFNKKGRRSLCVGGYLTDLKIWLFSRSEEGTKYEKNTCKKAWKIFDLTNF